MFDNPTASQSVFSMGTGTEFSGVHLPLLRFHEVLDDVLNCNTVLAELSPTLARLERVLDFQVLSKSSVGVIPKELRWGHPMCQSSTFDRGPSWPICRAHGRTAESRRAVCWAWCVS